jgi:hypothetical protein
MYRYLLYVDVTIRIKIIYMLNLIYLQDILLHVSEILVARVLSIFFGARLAQWVRSLDLTTHTSLSPIRRGFAPSFVNYKKGCTRLAAASDKVYQLLAQGRWFSPGTPASSTTKTGRHDVAEILLKVALNTKIQI